jgi:hypothetical protein
MAHVSSSLRTVPERLLAAWQTQQAAAKTRPQAAPTETSQATTSFKALLTGKAVSATLPAAKGCPPGSAAQAAVAAVLPAAQPAAATAAVVAPVLPAAQPVVAPAVAADAPVQNTNPTAQSVFGANPWMTNPTFTAPDGNTYGYNPYYFATPSTAAQVAQMVGGTVVPSDQLAEFGGFAQNQPNEMVQLPNGALINPGLIATLYTHGFPQAYIDELIQNEIQGA